MKLSAEWSVCVVVGAHYCWGQWSLDIGCSAHSAGGAVCVTMCGLWSLLCGAVGLVRGDGSSCVQELRACMGTVSWRVSDENIEIGRYESRETGVCSNGPVGGVL
ncbi:hypothetical protein Tco_1025518 [Tanacetum coccineum]